MNSKQEQPKKVLVVNGHPYDKSYVSALYQTFVSNIDADRFSIKTLELGKMKFDPVLRYGYSERMPADKDIELSQELLGWADHIVFFYPVWWASMPALLKGWFDRVLTPGFAYNVDGFKTIKHLKGRTAQLFITSDGPAWYERLIPNSPIRLMSKYILGFCGIKVVKSDILGMMAHPNRESARKKFLDKVAKAAASLR